MHIINSFSSDGVEEAVPHSSDEDVPHRATDDVINNSDEARKKVSNKPKRKADERKKRDRKKKQQESESSESEGNMKFALFNFFLDLPWFVTVLQKSPVRFFNSMSKVTHIFSPLKLLNGRFAELD